MSPELLIDGYNLMHAAGIAKKVARPGELERWRHRLIKRVSQALQPAERQGTLIVFDAKEAPEIGSREDLVEGIRIRYADRGHEADDLIEQLIAEHRFPHSLRVISSDHRIQKAARRRHAKFLDSPKFLDELDERQHRRPPEKPEGVHIITPKSAKGSGPAPLRPAPVPRSSAAPPVSKPETSNVDEWLKEFGDIEVEQLGEPEPPPVEPPTKAGKPAGKTKPTAQTHVDALPSPNRRAHRMPAEEPSGGPPIDPVLNDPSFWQQRINELLDD